MFTPFLLGLLTALFVALAVVLGSTLLGVETNATIAGTVGTVAGALYVAARRSSEK